MAMRKALSLALVVGTAVLTLAACSARTQLALEEEQKNGAHFATWSHMGYSVRRGTPETTTKEDIKLAQGDQCLPNQICKWWGEPVQVAPIQ
jgi:hypothetical protein